MKIPVGLLVRYQGDAADDADLPSDPEFRAALVGYLEWGTRLAMYNSQPGTDAVEQAPVPRWGWGVARPTSPETQPLRMRPGGRGLEAMAEQVRLGQTIGSGRQWRSPGRRPVGG